MWWRKIINNSNTITEIDVDANIIFDGIDIYKYSNDSSYQKVDTIDKDSVYYIFTKNTKKRMTYLPNDLEFLRKSTATSNILPCVTVIIFACVFFV